MNVGGFGSDSVTHEALGVGVGFRRALGGRGVVRVEGRYDHMFADSGNGYDMLSASVSLGITL